MTVFYTPDRNCAQLSTLPECTTVEVPSCFLGTRGHIRMAYLCNSRAGKYSDRCCSVMYVFLSKLLRMMIAACVHACGFVHWLAGGDITENAAPSLAKDPAFLPSERQHEPSRLLAHSAGASNNNTNNL